MIAIESQTFLKVQRHLDLQHLKYFQCTENADCCSKACLTDVHKCTVSYGPGIALLDAKPTTASSLDNRFGYEGNICRRDGDNVSFIIRDVDLNLKPLLVSNRSRMLLWRMLNFFAQMCQKQWDSNNPPLCNRNPRSEWRTANCLRANVQSRESTSEFWPSLYVLFIIFWKF